MNTNPQTAPKAHPHLPDDERRLFEYMDGRCSPEEAQAVRARLSSCAQCQAVHQQWHRLDSELSIALHSPALSADFVARLLERIEPGATPAPALSEPAETRVPFETEWQRHWAEHRKNLLRSTLPALLDYIGYAVALAVTGGLLSAVLNYFLKSMVASTVAPSSPLALPISCGIGAIFLFAIVALSSKVRLWRWLADL